MSRLADGARLAGLFASLHSVTQALLFLRSHEYLRASLERDPAAALYMAVLLDKAAAGIAVSESAVPFAALAGLTRSLPVSHCCACEPQAKGPV